MKTAMALWTLSNQETFREIGNLFGMNRGNAHYCIFSVLKVIATDLKPVYIKWPNASDGQRIAAEFESSSGIPDVIGCIDGTHIPIRAPTSDRDSYINRKQFPSINALAVCDNNKRFTYVYADRAGSVHDARVLRVCPLGQQIEHGTLCPSADKDKYHLLGDSAYPLLPSLLVPYRDNGHLSASQRKFNYIHSSTRSVVERAFGRLKGMFRRLRGIECTYPVNSLHLIEAAFVLHNFVLHHEHSDAGDDSFDTVLAEEDERSGKSSNAEFGNAAVRKAAKDKRDRIANSL